MAAGIRRPRASSRFLNGTFFTEAKMLDNAPFWRMSRRLMVMLFVAMIGFGGGAVIAGAPNHSTAIEECYCDCQECEDVYRCELEHEGPRYQCIDASGINPCLTDPCLNDECQCGEPPA